MSCAVHRHRFLGVARFVTFAALLGVSVCSVSHGKQKAADTAAEFQKILDHSGIVWNCWTGALAHLGVARANAMQAKTSQGADADVPASGRSPPTKTSSPFGKTPTPTSPS